MTNEDCCRPMHRSQESRYSCMREFDENDIEPLSNQKLTHFTQEKYCLEVQVFEWLKAAWVMRKSR